MTSTMDEEDTSIVVVKSMRESLRIIIRLDKANKPKLMVTSTKVIG